MSATFLLGEGCYYGWFGEPDYPKARDLLEAIPKVVEGVAMESVCASLLGQIYYDLKDPRALGCLKTTVERSEFVEDKADAHITLAEMYKYGVFVPKDLEKAYEHFKMAVELPLVKGSLKLRGVHLYLGHFIHNYRPHTKENLQEVQRCCELGISEEVNDDTSCYSRVILGKMFYRGQIGDGSDDVKAQQHFERALEHSMESYITDPAKHYLRLIKDRKNR